jgi:hypothetical protein
MQVLEGGAAGEPYSPPDGGLGMTELNLELVDGGGNIGWH